MNTEQAANFLNVSVHLMRKWRGQGAGPTYTKLGDKAIRYKFDHLIAFIDKGLIEDGTIPSSTRDLSTGSL